ncbi:hypothetical protein MUK70_19080 [Dyadobacter chenwenxiniae]|uniref:DUF3575 domain-containing protein n=1 Tax=Dyadobacter chenwenxiniae TaxID=2906456 RepID=A0A9X1TEC4_9BACT|nr:hypothetical protein [Dyadobacter chenwenxiniae]MCF0061345.1 hypothetical protein [Dyadobacter chenwenxiniae]UON81167.1 hypothetical protein MUK70_19080 [Dyadobacter chenwenxiniae]
MLLALVTVVLPNNLFGQDNLPLLQKQKKINFELFGISYRSETPIRNKLSHIFHGGLQYSFVITSGNVIEKYYSSLDAVAASGLRYYLNLHRKNEQNNGNFFQVDAGIKSGSIISRNMYYPAYVYLRPHWGIQIASGKRVSFELGAGLTIGSSIIEKYKGVAVAPNAQFRVGYLFMDRNANKNDF